MGDGNDVMGDGNDVIGDGYVVGRGTGDSRLRGNDVIGDGNDVMRGGARRDVGREILAYAGMT